MTLSFSRSSRNVVANWWWTIDKWLLTAVLFLLGCGMVLSLSASPAVAQKIGASTYHFVCRHAVYVCLSLTVMLGISMLGLKSIRHIALLGVVGSLFLVLMTLFFGIEIKGARRWLNLGVQIQPSEFLKPTYIVFTAWLFEMQRRYNNFKGMWISAGLTAVTCLMLFSQPDYGMTGVVAAIWFVQLFLAGVPVKRLILCGICLAVLFGVGYLALPHVQVRVAQMIAGVIGGDPSYQVKRSLEAFRNG